MLSSFELFGATVPSYAFFILLGYAVGFLVLLLRRKKYSIEIDNGIVMYIFAGIGSFVGGKVFYMIQYLPLYFELSAKGSYSFYDYFMQSGMVYYGGLFGCILFLLLFCVVFKYPFWKYIDCMLPILPLVHAFGRIGCFMVGCCYGMPFEGGICLNDSTIAPANVPLLPIQLIEAACVFGLFVFMIIRLRKPRKEGDTLGVYFLAYGIIRFILEFFRGDELRGHVLALSTSQWVSIIVIALGIFFLYFYKRKQKIS